MPVSVCFVSAFWWAAIVESSRGCLIDFAWNINASLSSFFVFVWYLVNTGANPARWQMFNWCGHMTMLGIKEKKRKKQENVKLKVFTWNKSDLSFCATKTASFFIFLFFSFFFALVLPGATSEGRRNISMHYNCNTPQTRKAYPPIIKY